MGGRPVVLISPCWERAGAEFDDESLSLSDCYSDAIHRAGGLPLTLPRIPSEGLVAGSMSRAEGLLLTGGDDIEPSIHRPRLAAGLRRKAGEPDPKRDLLELLLIQEALRTRKPLLAICRGHQILNVALGGDLLVDIASERPTALRHNCSELKDGTAHEIRIAPGSLMRKIVGRGSLQVNSCHHQAVNRLAPDLAATAESSDGIIEAMELAPKGRPPEQFLLAVQFHPERLCRSEPVFGRIFAAFIEACAPAAKA